MVLAMMEVRGVYIGQIAASLGVVAMVFSVTAPAWSQADENYALGSSLSDRFESGEFGEPLGEVRRQSKMQAALVSTLQPQYVYYVVPCDTPGAIRAGLPSTLDPDRANAGRHESFDAVPTAEASRDEDVCIALVDENRSDRAPLLYTYDSSYRYPEGYPNHHRSGSYSRTFASSINVGYSSSRRYGALPYGYGHYGYDPFGVRHYGGFPYAVGHYGPSYGSLYGNPYEPFPYGAYPYTSPYVSHHYSFGFGVGYHGGRHYGARHYGSHYSNVQYSRLGH